jgi:hypothetical protein
MKIWSILEQNLLFCTRLPIWFTPLEVGCQRELLVNKEKFLTGQAAGLSNGVKGL